MKQNTNIILYSILLFHIAWCLFSFYTMFTNFTGWSSYHWVPFILLTFTIAWWGACQGYYLSGLLYIGLVMLEFLSRAVLRGNDSYDFLKGLMFPVDLVFVAILLFVFKKHFGILPRETKEK